MFRSTVRRINSVAVLTTLRWHCWCYCYYYYSLYIALQLWLPLVIDVVVAGALAADCHHTCSISQFDHNAWSNYRIKILYLTSKILLLFCSHVCCTLRQKGGQVNNIRLQLVCRYPSCMASECTRKYVAYIYAMCVLGRLQVCLCVCV